MATIAKKSPVKKRPIRVGAGTVKKINGTNGKKDLSASYNAFKTFNGQQYTGMQAGRSHAWNYDQGEWKETKITPDLWEVSYAVTKRRKGKAPAGSGVPVGTGYHWYIVAHQKVVKLNANDYSTEMTGLKFKIAHKRADKLKWNTSAATQRKHLVEFLKTWISQLQKKPMLLAFVYNGSDYAGGAIPIPETFNEGKFLEFDIVLNNESMGILKHAKGGWKMDLVKDKGLIKTIGQEIEALQE